MRLRNGRSHPPPFIDQSLLISTTPQSVAYPFAPSIPSASVPPTCRIFLTLSVRLPHIQQTHADEMSPLTTLPRFAATLICPCPMEESPVAGIVFSGCRSRKVDHGQSGHQLGTPNFYPPHAIHWDGCPSAGEGCLTRGAGCLTRGTRYLYPPPDPIHWTGRPNAGTGYLLLGTGCLPRGTGSPPRGTGSPPRGTGYLPLGTAYPPREAGYQTR